MNAPTTLAARNPGMDADVFEQFAQQLQRYVRERLIPAEPQVIAEDRVPAEILAEMREMGLFGLSVPEEYGGAGLNMTQYARVVNIMSYAAPAYRSIFSINVGMFASALKNGATEAQRAEWFPQLTAGKIACFGLTEPGSGSDSAGLQTTAVPDPDGNGWILNGTKRYITNAPHADVALIMARTSREALPKNAHVSAFLVPMNAAGVSTGSPDKKMGQSGSHISDIMLDDVRVPGDALLGGETGKGFVFAMKSLDNGRISVGAAATGYARRALDSALRYANERKAFGEPIANFQ
ncbi:MAG: acyl-CoA dehydrogenase family protein, partial [Erythrobacteraceae bacterium]